MLFGGFLRDNRVLREWIAVCAVPRSLWPFFEVEHALCSPAFHMEREDVGTPGRQQAQVVTIVAGDIIDVLMNGPEYRAR
jgi:hypothetical protein